MNNKANWTMGKRYDQVFLQTSINDWQAYKKMLNIISYQRKANQNHSGNTTPTE